MSSNIIQDQLDFMKTGHQHTTGYHMDQEDLYTRLIIEEHGEWLLATLFETEQNQIKELVDILVVVLGKIISLGVDPQKAWDLVYANNMLKVTGKVVKDDNGKIIKSPEAIAAKAKMMRELEDLLPIYEPTSTGSLGDWSE